MIILGILFESPEIATSGIRASGFVGISEVDQSSEIQHRVSFGGKASTFIYLDLFSLISFCSYGLVFRG